MKDIATFLTHTNLEKSLLIGYYGGGNYGDELLLETIAHMLYRKGTTDITVTYQQPSHYRTFHHDFGFRLISMANRKQFFQAIVRNKQIIIGGGGLWGLDVNFNIFLLSLMLVFARFVLRKKVYILGVGYYTSTTRLGRISAWLAGKAANNIIARDQETVRNFRKITKRVTLDQDLAWNIPDLSLQTYQSDLTALERMLPIKKHTVFITLRRFKPSQRNHYTEIVGETLAHHPKQSIIVSLMEPKEVDPEGYALIKSWQKKYPNITIADFSYNPLALYLFFQKHHDSLTLIGPQFHVIITAELTGVPFLPIVYDNKVAELLKQNGTAHTIGIKDLTQSDINTFIERSRA